MREAFSEETNMLVAELVLPEGPSHDKIREGDVLIMVNGELLTRFIRLDEILDSSVGKAVTLMLVRGGKEVEVEIEVGDLYKITPDRFVSFSNMIFHTLSYQQARSYGVPCKGVYACDYNWLVQSIDYQKTPDLESFIEVAKTIPDKTDVVVAYKDLCDLHTPQSTIISVDRHWSEEMRLAVRNDKTGLWDFSNLGDALPPAPPKPRKAAFTKLENIPNPAIAKLVRSFVHVKCTMPISLDGFRERSKQGRGLVINAKKGLVVISRAFVPYDLCDISITIANSIIVEGKVLFLHPLQNYAIIQYNPKLIDAPVLAAKLSRENIMQGASTYFIGHSESGNIVHAATTITEVSALTVPVMSRLPRYRGANVDVITVDTNLAGECPSGILASQDGTVEALWLTWLGERSPSTGEDEEYYSGLATSSILSVVSDARQDIVPKLRMLPAEFRTIEMSEARLMGVSEEWIETVSMANTAHHRLFMVTKRTVEVERQEKEGDRLLESDILLTLNDQLITTISELNVMYLHNVLDAHIVREGQELHLTLHTISADNVETNHAVSFCGAILQRHHHAVKQLISKLPSEVYVSIIERGSPADQYRLYPTSFITHVNDWPTPDLGSFLAAALEIPENIYFRLRGMAFDGKPWVASIKKDEHYFPTVEWTKHPGRGWCKVTYEGGKGIQE